MTETTYYQRNREVILNTAKDYYENNKKLLSIVKLKMWFNIFVHFCFNNDDMIKLWCRALLALHQLYY